jgi:hypothetical protein
MGIIGRIFMKEVIRVDYHVYLYHRFLHQITLERSIFANIRWYPGDILPCSSTLFLARTAS